MEWLLSNEEVEEVADQPDAVNQAQTDTEPQLSSETQASESGSTEETLVAKSTKCEDCGKLFSTLTEVEFHSAKSGNLLLNIINSILDRFVR